MTRSSWIAILGRRDEPTDALEDYCRFLGKALGDKGHSMELAFVPWAERGRLGGLGWLRQQSEGWQGRWAVVQYTALSWSRRGFPAYFLAVIGLLRRKRVRCAVVFHDAQPYVGCRLIDRARRACQKCVMRAAYRWADKSLLTVPVTQVSWLPQDAHKASCIPVGANFAPAREPCDTDGTRGHAPKTVCVFGVTGGKHAFAEVADIGYALKKAESRVGLLRLAVFGRGSSEAERALRDELNGTGSEISVLGLLPPEEIGRRLATADVLLFVRGAVTSGRSTAIAGICCGLPVVGYRGDETGFPVTEAGVHLVPEKDRAALAEGLTRILGDDAYRAELRARSRMAARQYFSWDAIAARFVETLEPS